MAGSSTQSLGSVAALILGGPIITEPATLLSGQDLAAGTAVGRVTASGKLRAAVQTATDGSETIIGFMTEAVRADGADAACQIYKGGRINKDLAVIDASYSAVHLASMFDGTALTLETPTKSLERPTS